jgi:hypothetical protein
VIQIRSVSGAHLKHILSVNYPSLYTTALPQMARDLDISRRTLYAYIQEERRVPEYVEARIIQRWGNIPPSGWRTIVAKHIHTNRAGTEKELPPSHSIDLSVSTDATWTEIAKASVIVVAERLHGHSIGEWAGNPEMLDKDGKEIDLVAECRRCGMLVSIDAGLREINGFAWRAYCGSENLWKGAR